MKNNFWQSDSNVSAGFRRMAFGSTYFLQSNVLFVFAQIRRHICHILIGRLYRIGITHRANERYVKQYQLPTLKDN